jgi:glycosyltransferase involved in cell wall biosynthesis
VLRAQRCILPESPLTPMSDAPIRVLFANHNGHAEGGGGRVLHETVAGLRHLGTIAEVTTDLYPDVSGFDLVHAFNIWPIETSLPQMRYFGKVGVPIVWEPIFSDLHEFAWAMRAIRFLNELIADSQDWESVLAAIESSTLVVDGMSRWGPNEVIPGYLAAVAEMFTIATHVSVCSLHEIGMLSRVVPTVHTPFTVAHHGVAAQKFACADAHDFTHRYGLTDFILCVGSIERRKNQLLLVEAVRDLDRPIVLIGSVYPGDGDYLAMCRLRGGDALTYIDGLPHELVASAYKAAAVHVLPSFAEGSALSTMEAAAAGCEIVTSNRGSEFEYYGDLACTCDPLSPSSIRTAVEHALLQPRGEQLAARMRAFSWERTAEATLCAYRHALGSQSKT